MTNFLTYDSIEIYIGDYLCAHDLTEQQRKLDDLYYFLSATSFPFECTDEGKKLYILAIEMIKKKDILYKNHQNVVTFSDLIIDKSLLDIDINRNFINSIWLQGLNRVKNPIAKEVEVSMLQKLYKNLKTDEETLLFQKFLASKCPPNGVGEKPDKN